VERCFGPRRENESEVHSFSMKEMLLKNLAKYPLCDFFLRKCVESMSDKQVADDLAMEPDVSLLQHFDKPAQMGLLEEIFARTMITFGLSEEELKAEAEFNFDVYNMKGFESARAVFRLANALSEVGFSQFTFLRDEGLADLAARKDNQRWFIEVKTLVFQTKPQEFEIEGMVEVFSVDKFQPDTCNIADYIERIFRQIAGNPIEKARQQLLQTARMKGDAKKMVAIVVNLLAAGFFLEADNLRHLEAYLRGRVNGLEKDYLLGIDALAFLTNQLYLF